VKKAGAWFTYEGEQMGQGRENVKAFLRENRRRWLRSMDACASTWPTPYCPTSLYRCRNGHRHAYLLD